jgi:DNA repair protein RadD
MFDLYPHQTQVIEDLTQGYQHGHYRQVVGLATGTGKTVIAAHLGRRAAEKGRKMLFIVDRIELCGQAAETFAGIGLNVGILRGEDTAYTRQDEIIVASIQTIQSRSAPDWLDFAIIDECHILHAAHIRLMREWADKAFIGLSATPLRKGLGQHFTNLVRGPSIRQLTDRGFLVPVRAYAPQADAILSTLDSVSCGTTTAGYDYKERELGAAMNQKALVGDIVATWQEKGENRPTLCFAVNIAHSKSIRDDFVAAGVSAAHLDAYTEASERRELIMGFRAGRIRLLTSVNVLGIGFNVPDAACLILARPTLSLALHIQQCGRGIRTAQGKVDCVILDHSGNSLKHGLPQHFTVPDLDPGTKPDPAKKKRKEPAPFVACKACGAVMDPDEITCRACGIDRPVSGSRIVNREGQLVAFGSAIPGGPDGARESAQDFYLMARGYALAHGQKPGRAYHLTVARHPGVPIPWSWRDLPPLSPTAEVARWIQNRNLYDRIRAGHRRQA